VLISSFAFASDSSFIEKCWRADPNSIAECVFKEIQALGPPPTKEEFRLLYGEPDPPSLVHTLTLQWGEQVLSLQSSYLACNGKKPMAVFYMCMTEASNKEFSLHERFMESLRPDSWPRSLPERYARTYMGRFLYPTLMACDGRFKDEFDRCLKQALGRDPGNLLIEG
jgi:hypothetical protein